MIVTDHFVYIPTSRTAGTFLNRLIREHVPGARMLQYHGHLRDLPEEYSHLPVIGFVRNPWDWYVSMCFDYQRKRQFVFQVLIAGTALDFAATVSRFLTLGDNSNTSKRHLQQLVEKEIVRLFEETGAMNPSRRPRSFVPGYGPTLEQLVAKKDKYLIDRFDYDFSETK